MSSVPERKNIKLRIADRLLGIPLVALLGGMRLGKRRLPSSPPQRVALLKTAAIGDTVLLAGVVRDLRQAWPGAQITLFTGESNYSAALLLDGVDKVVRLPVTRPIGAVRRIRREGLFDIWFDFGQWPRLDALLSLGSRSRFTIGFRTPGQFRHYGYDLKVAHRRDVHETVNYRGLLAPFGVAGHSRPRIACAPAVRQERLVVFHMFPGGSLAALKEWPEGHWVELARRVLAAGWKLCLTGADADRPRAEALRGKIDQEGDVEVLAGRLTLRETADLLCSARAVVSVDTGIMHLASALGVPLVALHGPTAPRRWGPLSESAVVLRGDCPESGCIHLGFDSRCAHNRCMQSLDAEAVFQELARFLAGKSD